MAVTRANVISYLHSQLSKFETAAGVTADDNPAIPDSYHEVMNDTWMKLGIPYAERLTATLDDSKAEAARAVASVYALHKFALTFGSASNFDVAPGALKETYRQLLKQTLDLLSMALGVAADLGFSIALGLLVGGKVARRTRIRMPFLEGTGGA